MTFYFFLSPSSPFFSSIKNTHNQGWSNSNTIKSTSHRPFGSFHKDESRVGPRLHVRCFSGQHQDFQQPRIQQQQQHRLPRCGSGDHDVALLRGLERVLKGIKEVLCFWWLTRRFCWKLQPKVLQGTRWRYSVLCYFSLQVTIGEDCFSEPPTVLARTQDGSVIAENLVATNKNKSKK